MNFQELTIRLFSARRWPLYLFGITVILAELLNTTCTIINSLIWWGHVKIDLLIIESINTLIVTVLVLPWFIYLIHRSFNIQEMNRRLQVEIDERVKTENALRENEKMLRMVTDNSRDIIWIIDMNRRMTYISPAVKKVLGYTAEEYLTAGYENSITPASLDMLLKRYTEGGTVVVPPDKDRHRSDTIEIEQIRKDGQKIWIEMRAAFLRDADGKPIGVLGLSRDITANKKAEEDLRLSEEQYRLLFENVHDIVYSFDTHLKILNISPSVEKYLGYKQDEYIGKFLSKLTIFPDEDMKRGVARLMRYLQGESLPPQEFKAIAKDGRLKHFEVSGAPIIRKGEVIGIIAVARDITAQKEAATERERMQEQLNQAQKLEAIGTLAGGIAHDFNNLLMGIQGFASLMLLDTDPGHPHYEKIKNIEMQVHSGADLTRQLLGFARGGRYEVKTANLNEIAKKTSEMFGRTKKEISIRPKYEQDLWPTDVDGGQIEQVLMNLYVNAWQAMPAGGELCLETQNCHLAAEHAERLCIEAGRYVKLSVADTGIGMDENTKERIFEPFFTTKEMGRGTGLGLATVYGIIRGHKGAINVNSKKGQGTTFNLYLPASVKEIHKKAEEGQETRRGDETILLVDDEDIVLKVTEMLLKNLGYRVLTANSGQEAIDTCRAQKGMIDLVLLDMVMPGINGSETYDQLKVIAPDLKVILSSGYSLNEQAARILKKGCKGFIQKPFNASELSQAIGAALEKGTAAKPRHPISSDARL